MAQKSNKIKTHCQEIGSKSRDLLRKKGVLNKNGESTPTAVRNHLANIAKGRLGDVSSGIIAVANIGRGEKQKESKLKGVSVSRSAAVHTKKALRAMGMSGAEIKKHVRGNKVFGMAAGKIGGDKVKIKTKKGVIEVSSKGKESLVEIKKGGLNGSVNHAPDKPGYSDVPSYWKEDNQGTQMKWHTNGKLGRAGIEEAEVFLDKSGKKIKNKYIDGQYQGTRDDVSTIGEDKMEEGVIGSVHQNSGVVKSPFKGSEKNTSLAARF